MATTPLVFETIIIGFQVIVWILLLLSILGFGWLDELKQFEAWAIVGSAVFIGFSYVIGVMFSQLSGVVGRRFSPTQGLLKDMLGKRNLQSATAMKVYIWTKDLHTAKRLEGKNCALLQATCVNVPLICICGSILALKVQGFSWPLLGVYGLASIALSGFTLWTYFRAVRDYYEDFGASYDQLKNMS